MRRRAGRLPSLAIVGSVVLTLAVPALATTIIGTPRSETLRGTRKADHLDGGAGDDHLLGLAGDDILIGGPGGDVLSGGSGADVLNGGSGDDVLVGGPGADIIGCGKGDDTAHVDGRDIVSGDCEHVLGLPERALSVADASVPEGDVGPTTLSFPVTLSRPSTTAVIVAFATADGTATAPSDYASATGTITFNPGEISKTIGVAVNGDYTIEPDETFSVTLSAPVGATIANASATGTITNDDVPRPPSGSYSGMTDQGFGVTFDVADGAVSLSNINLEFNTSCDAHVVKLDNLYLTWSSPIKINSSDWSFSDALGSDTVDTSVRVYFRGSLTTDGKAVGSFQGDVSYVTHLYQHTHCTSGTVAFTASHT